MWSTHLNLIKLITNKEKSVRVKSDAFCEYKMDNIKTKKEIKKEFKLLFGVYSDHIVTSLSQGKNPINAMDRILMLVDSYKKKLEA